MTKVRYLYAPVAILGASLSAYAADEGSDGRIEFKGDFRLRYETIAEDGESDRNRARFRARLGASAMIADDVKVIVQLASGGDDPVSTNQTFDDGFSSKDIGIDLAFVDWKINDKLSFYGGKMRNPLRKTAGASLIWDSDLNPEGFALEFSSGTVFGTVAGFSVEERGSADDSLLYAVQAGFEIAINDSSSVTTGAGYFAYTNTTGNAPFYDSRAKGNTVDLGGNYVNDYKNTEIFAQLDTKLDTWPLKIFAHLVRNSEVSSQDTGYAIGAKIGAAKSDGAMEFSWTYQDIEADAAIGTFSESDFGGGGTDSDGHMLKAKYAISKKIVFGGTYFVNSVDRFQGTEHDYNRLQLDVEFKFD